MIDSNQRVPSLIAHAAIAGQSQTLAGLSRSKVLSGSEPKSTRMGPIGRWSCAMALALSFAADSPAQSLEHAPTSLGQDWTQALLDGQDASHFPRPAELSGTRAGVAKQSKPGAVPTALERLLAALDSANRAGFVLAWEQLEAKQLLRWARFDSVEARVANRPEAKQRVLQARAQTDAGWQQLRLAGELLIESWPKGGTPSDTAEFRRHLGTRFAQALPDRPLLGFQALPVRRLQASAPTLPETPAARPSYESVSGCSISATEGIHAAPEAPLHAEILAKASELEFEYTRIYDFVRTQIDTEWYAGSQRGALGTLRSGRGNDVDQSSLLLALLRAASVNAQYIHGAVEVPLAMLEQSLGLQGATRVQRAMNRALRAHRPVLAGGVVVALEMDYTWVVAHIPWSRYRGSAAFLTDRQCLSLDTAIKPYVYAPASGVLADATIDVDGLVNDYLTQIIPEDPLTRLRALVGQHLGSSGSTQTFEQQLAAHQLQAQTLELLPASTAFKVLGVFSESANLPEALRSAVTLRVDSDGGATLSHTLSLAEALSSRLTLSFQPASWSDQNLINEFGGLSQVPAYLVQVRPKLSVNGQAVAVGEAMPLAQAVHLEVELSVAGQNTQVAQNLLSGAYAAIVLGQSGLMPEAETANAELEGEGPAARVLSNLARRYSENWNRDADVLADLIGVRTLQPLPSIAIVLSQLAVERVEGVPLRIDLDTIGLDAALRATEAISSSNEPSAEQQWLQLTALQGAVLERQVFDQQWAVPAVSGDRLLAEAAVAGIALLDLQGAAAAASVGSLNHADPVKDAVIDWLLAGYRVRLPESALSVGAWHGSAWLVSDDQGSSGYFLSGGLAGGMTVLPLDEWYVEDLARLLSDPYAPTPNPDPLSALYVKLDAEAQDQMAVVGEFLDKPLTVRVEDGAGRPVVGATVTFEVALAAGELSAGGSTGTTISIPTDNRGLAQPRLRAGMSAEFKSYITLEDAEHPQELQTHHVRISVASNVDGGSVSPGEVYRAYGLPGPPVAIEVQGTTLRIQDADVGLMLVSIGYETYSFSVVDANEIPIANREVKISASISEDSLPDRTVCTDPFPLVDDTGVFLPGQCPAEKVTFYEENSGGCWSQEVTSLTKTRDNTAHVVSPHIINSIADVLFVDVESGIRNDEESFYVASPGHEICGFSQRYLGSAYVGHLVFERSGDRKLHFAQPGWLRGPSGNLRSDDPVEFGIANSIESAPPGEALPNWRRFLLMNMFEVSEFTPEINPYGLTLAPQVEENGAFSYLNAIMFQPAIPDPQLGVSFFFPEGGELLEFKTAPSEPRGWFAYKVQMPQTPARVDGTVEIYGRCLGNSANGQADCPARFQGPAWPGPVPVNEVYRYKINLPPAWAVTNTINPIEPSPASRSVAGTVAQDLVITATIEPSEFATGPIAYTLLEDGREIIGANYPIGTVGQFQILQPKGWPVDLDKSYSVKVAINDGTPFRIESDEMPILFSSDVIAGMGAHSNPAGQLTDGELISLALFNSNRKLTVTHSVDIPNDRICERGGELVFFLAQDADVTLELRNINFNGVEDVVSDIVDTVLIDGESRDRGLHRVAVELDQVAFGRYQYELRAIGQTGDAETEFGELIHREDLRDHRALGHSVVKGVDVYDGQLSLSRADAQLAGRGPGLRFTRTYSYSQGDRPGPYGRGWSSLADSHLSFDACGVVQVVGSDGGGGRFVYEGEGGDGSVGYGPLDGYHSSLVQNASGAWDFYAVNGTRYRYAGSGDHMHRLLYIEDPSGNRVDLEYALIGSQSVVTGLVESSGRRLELIYAEIVLDGGIRLPLLQRLTGPDGIAVNYEYDSAGNLLTVTRAGGSSTDAIESYEYEDLGYVPDVTTPEKSRRVGWRLRSLSNAVNGAQTSYGNLLQWSYATQPNGGTVAVPAYRITSITESDAGTVSFGYGGLRGLDLPTSTLVTNARGHATTYAMNGFGGVTQQTDPIGSTGTVWDLQHRQPASITDPEGVVTTYGYDFNGNTTSQVISGTGGTVSTTASFEPEASFNPPFIKNRAVTQVDFRGVASTLSYDLQGRLSGRTKGVVSETFSYAGNGDQVGWTDYNGNATLYSYDANGLRAGATLADGSTRTANFDQRGRQSQSTDENGRSTTYTYDGHDRLTSTEYPGDGAPLTISYDDAALGRTETDELARATVYGLDRQGRVLTITNPDNDARSLSYDDHGNLLSETDFRGNQSVSTYDAGDRRDSLIEPEGRSTSYTYDDIGNMLESILDGAGGPRTMRYAYAHPRYFKTGEYGVLGGDDVGNTYELDGEGAVLSMSDALARDTVYTLDAFGRPLTMAEHGLRTTTYTYDAFGNRVGETVSGAGGARKRSYDFDSRNREISMTDRTGARWSRDYDGKGNLTRLTDPLGRVANYEYDARDRLTRQTLPGESRAYSYVYDAVSNRTEESKPSGQNLSHSYDLLNRLTSSTDQLGTIASFKYDKDGNALRYTDGRSSATIATYNGLSQKLTEARPETRNLSWTWSVHGEVLSETDARAYTTTHAYDTLGRRTSSTDPIGTRSWGLDAIGNILTETDRLNRITVYAYDALDRRKAQTDPSPLTTTQSWTYSAIDEVLTHTDRRDIDTVWTYDGESRVKTETHAGITMAINAYDNAGQRTSLTDALNRVTTFNYDAAGRWITEARPAGAIRTRTWWPTDDPQSETDADGVVVNWTYDVRRRLLNEANGLSETTTHAYDGNGNRTGTTRPQGNDWTYEFDHADRLEAVVDPLTNRTEYDYDPGDNRKVLRDANTNERLWDYDELNRPVRMEYPDSAVETTTVDVEGNPTLTVRANGQEIERDFDGLNRLIEERFDPVAEDRIQSIAYHYDGNGNPLLISETLTDGPLSCSYTYDDFDRPLSMTDRNGRTVSYTYDLVGNRTERSGPEGRTDYAYNGLDQLVSVTPPNSSAIVLTPSKAGRWGEIAHPNGTRTEVSYDPAGRTNGVRHWLGAAAVVLASYGFDANGNRATQTIEAGGQSWQTTYAYDVADRLEGYTAPEGSVSYVLDPVGNRTQENLGGVITKSEYDVRDQLQAQRNGANVVLATYSYDAAGRQISRDEAGSVTHYGYSAKDRMTSIRQGSTAATPIVEYEYGPQGQRSARVNSASREEYQWDGHDLAARTNAVGNVLGSYTNANGWTVASFEGPDRYYYHLDALGTPLALTDSGGGVAVRYRSDPWGKPLDQSGPHPNPVGFTGYIKDSETEQLYAQARQYEPGVGRFSSVDEWAGDSLRPLSLNQYLYGFGNPGVFVDPDGRCGALIDDPVRCAYLYAAATGDTSLLQPQIEGSQRGRVRAAGAVVGTVPLAAESAVGIAKAAVDAPVGLVQGLAGGALGRDAADRNAARFESMHQGLAKLASEPVETILEPHRRAEALAAQGRDFEAGSQYSGYLLTAAGAPSAVRSVVSATSPAASALFKPRRVVEGVNGETLLRFDPDGEAGSGFQQHPVRLQGQSASQVSSDLVVAPKTTPLRQTTILGENMRGRVIPFASATNARTLSFGTTAERWAQMTPRQRWKLNDGALRARINEGDSFRYIGIDRQRPVSERLRFDLTQSELLRLRDREITYDTIIP